MVREADYNLKRPQDETLAPAERQIPQLREMLAGKKIGDVQVGAFQYR